jgi:hypothetical protein
MRAFEITVNGKTLCVAGVGDEGVLSAVVDWTVSPKQGDLSLTVGGLIGSSEHVSWIRREPLALGDEVRVRIVEVSQADEATHRQRNRPGPARNRYIGGIIGPY